MRICTLTMSMCILILLLTLTGCTTSLIGKKGDICGIHNVDVNNEALATVASSLPGVVSAAVQAALPLPANQQPQRFTAPTEPSREAFMDACSTAQLCVYSHDPETGEECVIVRGAIE